MCHLFKCLTHEYDNSFSDEKKKLKERNNDNVIPINSDEAKIVADCIECGGSIDQAHILALQCELDREIDVSGHASILGLIRRLNHVKVVVKEDKQGSQDPTSP